MTITAPVDGDPIDPDWAQQITDAVNSLVTASAIYDSARPAFQIYSAAVQSIPNNTYTALTHDTERLDSASGHSTSSNTSRYTPSTPGYWFVVGRYTFAANATGFRGAVLATNGTQLSETRQLAAGSSAASSSLIAVGVVALTTLGDYVEVMGIQNTGAGLNTDTSNSQFCSLSGFLVKGV